MPLVLLPSQPIVVPEIDDCSSCDQGCYCVKYNANDKLYWQAQQTPCSADILCDSDFEDVFGDELITNGGFDTNASGWSPPDGWHWDSGSILFEGAATGYIGQAFTLTASVLYKVIFTISDMTTGYFIPILGDVFSGTTGRGEQVTENGTYVQYITCGFAFDALRFYGKDNFDGRLDDVSVVKYESACWDFGVISGHGINWIVNDEGGMCHIPGETTSIFSLTAVVTIGGYYMFQITISDSTAGSITINSCNVSENISGNGTFVGYFLPTAGGLTFEIAPSDDFDGCVSEVHYYKMSNDFTAMIIDSETGADVKDVTSKVKYYKQWVTINEYWGNLMAGVTKVYGCYKLKIIDNCASKTYIFNCMCLEISNTCQNIVEAYSESPAFGFEFENTGFRLSHRLQFSLTTAEYPEDTDSYLYSNGEREYNFTQVEDFLTLFFEPVPKIVHDTISKQRRLKHFSLGDKDDNLTEYFAKAGIYQPEWSKQTTMDLAPSRFDVRKKSGNIFMSNCE